MEENKVDGSFIRQRITQLRIMQNISEYRMSIDLGHSKGYIQNISSGRSMPSAIELLAICDYLGVTPEEFFRQPKKHGEDSSEDLETLFMGLNSFQKNLLREIIKQMK